MLTLFISDLREMLNNEKNTPQTINNLVSDSLQGALDVLPSYEADMLS